MNIWLVVTPLILGTVLYALQAAGYAFFLSRPGMCAAFIGYVIANAGLIYDAITQAKG